MPNIYLTTNIYHKMIGVNPYRYIGSDQNDNNEYFGSSKLLKEDIEFFGKENFIKEILKFIPNIDNKSLRRIETHYLKHNNVKLDKSYYNLTDDYSPAGGKKGMKHRKKVVRSQKWIDARKGHACSKETRDKMRQKKLGRRLSKETIDRMIKSRTGEKNKTSLKWEVISPSGEIFTVISLRNWCKENNLNYLILWHNKEGWKCSKI